MTPLGLTEADADAILEKVVTFEDSSRYERLKPMTNFRKDDGAFARILYRCRRVSDGSRQNEQSDDIFVMKVKVQVPSEGQKEPIEGPGIETAAELRALKAFAQKKRTSVPHLVTWKRITQAPESLFPGGYIIFTIMTLMPGETLLDLGFWGLTSDTQEAIRAAFLIVLKDIWHDGFVPYDRALRNILWENETRQCSIVDFEHYHLKEWVNMDEKDEMQRWGVLRRPALTWYQEWGLVAP